MKRQGKYVDIDWEEIYIKSQYIQEKYPDLELQIEVKEIRENRTSKQNKYLWGGIYKVLSDYTGYTPEEIHEFCKMKFLRNDKYFGKDGKINIPKIGSTTELDTKEMTEYIENIRNWSSANLGLYILTSEEFYAGYQI